MANLNDLESLRPALSESQQMYLVTIARQRGGSEPIPLSDLAEGLSVSAVSVNEMCRRLQEQGLVTYLPYKGVSLTEEGKQQAQYVLRRHRLWEVFLVNELGLNCEQAHAAACQLEHATPDLVTERLDTFLGRPAVDPEGDAIPRTDGSLPARWLVPLTAVPVGREAYVVTREVDAASRVFLDEAGIRPGVSVTILVATVDSLLVRVDKECISVERTLAEGIQVEIGTSEAEERRGRATEKSGYGRKGGERS